MLLRGLNYLFVNLLIILALYGLWATKPKYFQHLVVIVISLALLYNFGTVKEGFYDFSQRPRASLDIFCWKKENLEDNNSPTKFVCKSNRAKSDEKDRCSHCDGLCLQGAVGRNYPPGAKPLCHRHPLITNQSGFYKIQSAIYPKKYLAYDLQGMDGQGMPLYLAKPTNAEQLALPDLVWRLDRGLDTFTISTCNQPPLFLVGNRDLSMSYFKSGNWQFLQGANDTVLISTEKPTLYLTTDGNQISLGSYLHYWKLEPVKECTGQVPTPSTPTTPTTSFQPLTTPTTPSTSFQSLTTPFQSLTTPFQSLTTPLSTLSTSFQSLTTPTTPTTPFQPLSTPSTPSQTLTSFLTKIQEGFANILQFPDTPKKTQTSLKNYGSLSDWNQYYSQYWNGEYTYKNTTPTNKDYLTIHLNLDGSGTVITKDEKWTVMSVGADLVYGENDDSYLYVEMLTPEKGGAYYNPNQPQVKIVVKKKNTLHPELISLVSSDPNNFNAYSYKIGLVGDNVKAYPMEKFQNQNQNQNVDDPRMLGIGFLDATLGYNLPQVNLTNSKPCNLGPPTKAPMNMAKWSKLDQTGRLRQLQQPNLPLEVRYTYRYQCQDGTNQESLPSPSLMLPRSISNDNHYYGALVKIFGNPENKDITAMRLYSRPQGTKNFSLSQEISQNSPEVTVSVIPEYLQKGGVSPPP